MLSFLLISCSVLKNMNNYKHTVYKTKYVSSHLTADLVKEVSVNKYLLEFLCQAVYKSLLSMLKIHPQNQINNSYIQQYIMLVEAA